MAQYTYKARNGKGELITGMLEARDPLGVASQLRTKSIYAISIAEIKKKQDDIENLRLKELSYKELMVFCKQFHTMLAAGLTVIACVDLLKKQTQNKTLASVLTRVYNDLQKGMSLSEAMAVHTGRIPYIMISMIEVGEISGNIDIALERLVVHFTKENKIKQKIVSAMMYPLVIGFISLVLVIFMLMFVVPRFIGIFDSMSMELPLPTKVLKFVSELIRSYKFYVALPIVIILGRYIVKKLKSSYKIKRMVGEYLVKVPLIGPNYVKILASRFSRTLSLLLKTGIPLIQSLEVIEKVVANVLISKGIENVIEEVKNGSNLAEPLEKMGVFPIMVTQMISVGEEAGSLDSIVETVADFYDEEVDVAIGKITSMIEPVMIFLLAIVIGSIVISMIYPMFTMYQGMN